MTNPTKQGLPAAPAPDTGPGGTRPTGPPPAAVQRVLLRFAQRITSRPKTVILVWAVLIALCTPFALQLTSVLTDQGASKVVPGTSSARAEELTATSFPHRSQREVVLVLEADRVNTPEVRRFLAELDTTIAALQKDGEVERSSSAFTLHRDATAQFLTGIRARADAQAPAGDAGSRREFIDREIAQGRVPAPLEGPARAAVTARDAAAVSRIAGAFAAGTDWQNFPLDVPEEAAARLIAEDGTAALASVSYTAEAGNDPDVEGLRDSAGELLDKAGLGGQAEVHVTGELALIHDTYEKAESDNALMESVAYVIIFVVLLLFFRAIVPAVLTLVVIGLAMNVSQAALYLLGKEVTLTQFTVTIMTFVMLGAGVDYSMLLSSRYRQERLAGRAPREAAVQATVHAGESMLLAAIAVALAFGATLLSPVDWIPPLGYGGLLGIPIVLAAALTLTPCLLVLLGDRFFALGRAPLSDLEHTGAVGRHLRRTAEFARRRKVAIVVVFLAVTVPFALVVADSRSTADPVALSPATDSRDGFETVAERWGDAAVLPTVVVGASAAGTVDKGALSADGQQAVARLTDQLAATKGVASVDSATHPFGTRWTADEVAAMPQSLRDDYVARDGSLRFVVALEDDPYSPGAAAAVQRVEKVTAAARSTVGELDVGGATQVDRQYGSALSRSFWQMVVLVSIGVFVMLVIALRSLLVPIRLIGTIMLSNVWAVGLTVLIFHHWRGEAIIDDLPIFLTVLMMGLGMDYEIFLVTRVRDLARSGLSQEEATLQAVVDTGRVINAAGLVMAGSLGTMALSSTLMLQEYGAGLGLAVLLDATLIRMLFVPATLLLFRKYNWWMPSFGRSRQKAPG
ncbi:MMPL family transporter [Streptomyces sp. NBC_01142]|uniref:MMPL family transporter n=1 Tax=Streptomyces sp. NBC_01142 TaxID=2975865 RepID=UPI00225C2DBB|nr:MMPL family transporter [Streptomyces sp. NBC_01142]MCX4821965.1 MMPL family transporter [Streptomyces sp. NBC_01142]